MFQVKGLSMFTILEELGVFDELKVQLERDRQNKEESCWSWSWQGSNGQEGHVEIFGRYHKDNGKPVEDVKLDGDMITCAGCASREQEWCERG